MQINRKQARDGEQRWFKQEHVTGGEEQIRIEAGQCRYKIGRVGVGRLEHRYSARLGCVYESGDTAPSRRIGGLPLCRRHIHHSDQVAGCIQQGHEEPVAEYTLRVSKENKAQFGTHQRLAPSG